MRDEGGLNARFAWAIAFALLAPSIAARAVRIRRKLGHTRIRTSQ